MAPKKEEKQPKATPEEIVGGELGNEDEVKEEDWNKELTEEQLQHFNKQSGTNEEVVKYIHYHHKAL